MALSNASEGEQGEEEIEMRSSEGRRRHLEHFVDMEMEEGISGSHAEDTQPLISGGRDGDDDEGDEKAYESLLNKVGFGKFQILLLLVCGWANASGMFTFGDQVE